MKKIADAVGAFFLNRRNLFILGFVLTFVITLLEVLREKQFNFFNAVFVHDSLSPSNL